MRDFDYKNRNSVQPFIKLKAITRENSGSP